jgi:hypothetical protein
MTRPRTALRSRSPSTGAGSPLDAPEKAALARLVHLVGAVSVQATILDYCPAVSSRSLLYALIDPYRANRPSLKQLREVASAIRFVALTLGAAADDVESLAAH